ncbi:MAG: VWA domain-containing protein [Lentimicrobiaceae bacterium]|nr:VWA domain-containing protein [Lentimicrobiaceae bacterium]
MQKVEKSMFFKRFLGIIFVALACGSVCSAQSKGGADGNTPLTRILFIYDASNSMWGDWQSDKKINIANRLLSKMIDSLENYPNLELALRVYGHQKDFRLYDCSDTKLEVPFAPDNFLKIKQKLKSLSPKGTTPIALSLEAAADDFPPCSNCKNVIVLITDGIEECKGDPCAASQALQKKGIILKPFIIGIGANFGSAFDCVGTYIDASSEIDLDYALTAVIRRVMDETTCQVNLLDKNQLPTETNVNMSFYNAASGILLYNYIHTLNARGVPDTLHLDPMPEYRIKIHTLPPIIIDSARLTPGKHTVIAADAPQGKILLKMSSSKNNRYQIIPILVRQAGKNEILNIQYFNTPDKYIVGTYDIEVLCLPRVLLKDVEVSQSYTTEIRIPNPGFAEVRKSDFGSGSLYVINDGKEEWIYNLREDNTSESILLQPGNYKVVFRRKNEYKTIKTQEVKFIIKSDMTTTVNIPK